jgi:hypothetical protein
MFSGASTMEKLMDNAATWLKYAAETRRIAAHASDQAARDQYLRLAAGYVNLARIALARIELG